VKNFWHYIIGIMFFLLGLLFIDQPVFWDPKYQMTIDISNVKWPFGLSLIVFGLVYLWLVITKKLGNSCYWICPKCEDVFKLNSNGEKKYCDNCGTSLEKLEGYYKRISNKK